MYDSWYFDRSLSVTCHHTSVSYFVSSLMSAALKCLQVDRGWLCVCATNSLVVGLGAWKTDEEHRWCGYSIYIFLSTLPRLAAEAGADRSAMYTDFTISLVHWTDWLHLHTLTTFICLVFFSAHKACCIFHAAAVLSISPCFSHVYCEKNANHIRFLIGELQGNKFFPIST